jgi:LysR family transcriptional activator of nhaA
MINYNHLFYFYIVVKEGGVSQAARHLKISQPALSAQIKQFEKAFGCELFQRVGRNLQTTEQGDLIFGYARQMFELASELMDRMQPSPGAKGQRIQIGVCDDVERPFAVDVIGGLFKKENLSEQPRVTLLCGEHSDLVSKLKGNVMDVVLSSQPIHDSHIRIIEKLPMPIVLACSAKAGSKSESLTAHYEARLSRILSETGLVMPTKKFRLRQEIDSFLDKEGIASQIVFEGDLLAAVVRAVVDGVGAAFVPFQYVAKEVVSGRVNVIAPPGGFWVQNLYLMTRQRPKGNPMVNELQKSLKGLKKLAPEMMMGSLASTEIASFVTDLMGML